jgi:hypothetical protein
MGDISIEKHFLLKGSDVFGLGFSWRMQVFKRNHRYCNSLRFKSKEIHWYRYRMQMKFCRSLEKKSRLTRVSLIHSDAADSSDQMSSPLLPSVADNPLHVPWMVATRNRERFCKVTVRVKIEWKGRRRDRKKEKNEGGCGRRIQLGPLDFCVFNDTVLLNFCAVITWHVAARK